MTTAERADASAAAAAAHGNPAPATDPAPPSKLQLANSRLPRLLVMPGVGLLLLLVVFPIIMELYISFTRWSPTSPAPWYLAYRDWTWLGNYYEGLTSYRFYAAIARTVVITVVAVGIQFVLGFTLALLFFEKFPLKRLMTVFLLIPMMVLPAVSGFVFFLLLTSDGPVNAMLTSVLPGTVSVPWLTHPTLAVVSVILVDVWQWTPLMFLIFMAGLAAVPEDQLNAARLLGASWWQRLRMVILPMLRPIMLIALIIRGMEAFKIFDSAWLLTRGGPGEASSTISVFLYREAFLSARWSYVAALAVIVMIFVSLIAFQAIKPIEARQEADT
jgi:multiple sugar transport system permease protein